MDNCTPKKEEINTGIIDTENVYLKANYCLAIPVLPNLDIYSKTCLTEVLEKIDYQFGTATNSLNFKTVVLPHLRSTERITNLKTFSESVDIHLQLLKNNYDISKAKIDNNISILEKVNTDLKLISFPAILDTTNIGITIHDGLKTVLQKIVNNIKSQVGFQTSVTTTESSSLKFTLSGTDNHNILGNIKLSGIAGNIITLKSDGLFSSQNTNDFQKLTLVGNILSIDNGNSVTLLESGLQTLSLNNNLLKLSGNNSSVPLPVFQETALVVTSSSTIAFSNNGTSGHNVSASAKISPITGNQLTDNNGLYVKIGADEILNEITNGSSVLRSKFLNLIQSVQIINFRWEVLNSSTTVKTLTYVNSSGTSSTISLVSGETIIITGSKILLFDLELQINFLGQQTGQI